MSKSTGLEFSLPIARPPWTKLGKRMESQCRKALYEIGLDESVKKIAVALSGGKDSLTLLYLLHAIKGKGFPNWELYAIHISGAFSCGASLQNSWLKRVCEELEIPLIEKSSSQSKEGLACYSCSRERRRLLFQAAKEHDIFTVAFGHHRDDSVQTLLLNLLHKAEFAANLAKVPMHDYGVTIIRPLIYIAEEEIKEWAKMYGFLKITCQCPVGQNSRRRKVETLIQEIESIFPNARRNLAKASIIYGSDKALRS